jgi:hypothetical protein
MPNLRYSVQYILVFLADISRNKLTEQLSNLTLEVLTTMNTVKIVKLATSHTWSNFYRAGKIALIYTWPVTWQYVYLVACQSSCI